MVSSNWLQKYSNFMLPCAPHSWIICCKSSSSPQVQQVWHSLTSNVRRSKVSSYSFAQISRCWSLRDPQRMCGTVIVLENIYSHLRAVPWTIKLGFAIQPCKSRFYKHTRISRSFYEYEVWLLYDLGVLAPGHSLQANSVIFQRFALP